MNITRTLAMTFVALALLLIGDAPRDAHAPLGLQLVSEAHAIFGVRRRTARRWAVVGASTAAAASGAAYSKGAADQHQADMAQQQTAPRQAAPAAATGDDPLPLGTVAQSLPPGCTPTPVGKVQYYYCDGNFYRAVLQGNSLVYVTAKP